MSAFNGLREWISDWIEYFTAETIPNCPPSDEELDRVAMNADIVAGTLDDMVTAIERFFPHLEDSMIPLIKTVEDALCEDSGGTSPEEVLGLWRDKRGKVNDCKIFTSPGEKKAMMVIYNRWSDRKKINHDFWGLRLFDENDKWNSTGVVTEEQMGLAQECLEGWLQQRKAGKLYQMQ